MKIFVSYIFSLDIRIRAAVLMALFIVIFWWVLGKTIIRLLSFLLYLLRGVFKGVYLLFEMPVCWIHRRGGSFFYGIDNGLAGVGDKIDTFLERWHACWRNPKSSHIFVSIVVYFVLLIWICIPYYADEEDVKSFSGQVVYLKVENKLTNWLELHNMYEELERVREGIVMKVITQKNPLPIRDIPSIENCEILESVEKENTVYWKGEIAFSSVSDEGIEPWIKVKTSDGTIGWARLIYLCPANEKDFELKLKW